MTAIAGARAGNKLRLTSMSKNNPRVVVVGGGTMGSGIALVFAAGNWAVDIVEPAAATRAALPAYLRESLQRMGAHADTSRIATVGTLSDVAWSDVDLVVESANED